MYAFVKQTRVFKHPWIRMVFNYSDICRILFLFRTMLLCTIFLKTTTKTNTGLNSFKPTILRINYDLNRLMVIVLSLGIRSTRYTLRNLQSCILIGRWVWNYVRNQYQLKISLFCVLISTRTLQSSTCQLQSISIKDQRIKKE